MSLLKKILDGEKKIPQPAEERKPAENSREEKNSGPPAEPLCPCLDCWSPTFWRSAYGGPLRCAVCEPWPSLSLVGERWTLYKLPDRTLTWVPCLRRGERTTDRPPLAGRPDELPGWTARETEDEDVEWLTLERVT